jgi:hypothetical protein
MYIIRQLGLMDIKFMLYNPEMKHYHQSWMGASRGDHLHNEIIRKQLRETNTVNNIVTCLG